MELHRGDTKKTWYDDNWLTGAVSVSTEDIKSFDLSREGAENWYGRINGE